MTDTRHDADVAFIQALANLLKANDLSELEVHRDYGDNDSLNVRVARHATPVAAPASAMVAAPAAAPVIAPPVEAETVSDAPEDPARHPGAVTSPMVGTVYMQAEPGADPFIEAGSTVSKGQTLMIVEAMKTMNQIPAPRDGVVRRVLVEDGAPVEFGAPLVILD
ncbi:MAG: acetyl-CoA carboxylase biotin carboxyl carrier protein [Pseudomonadota bacterium]